MNRRRTEPENFTNKKKKFYKSFLKINTFL